MSSGKHYYVAMLVACSAVGCAAASAVPRENPVPVAIPTSHTDSTIAAPQPAPPAIPAPSIPDPIRTQARAAHPGFDARYYPGDAALLAWHDHSPYEWMGYYLVAPCQTGTTWVGKRSSVQSAGFGTAIVFLGEQDWSGPPSDSGAAAKSGGTQCTVKNLTAAKGAIDAARADSTAAAEGFAAGSIVYLDIERVETMSARFEEYIRSWIRAMLRSGRYTPGVYVHERNANAVYAMATSEYAAAGGAATAPTTTVPMWVAARGGSSGFDIASAPAASGFAFATVWQGRFNVIESWGGVTIKVDANVAASADPSAPR